MNSGPVLQAAFVPIGYPGPVNIDAFHFNMYTSPALMSIIIYLGLALLMVRYFNEYVVLDNAIQNDTAKIVEINTGTDGKFPFIFETKRIQFKIKLLKINFKITLVLNNRCE